MSQSIAVEFRALDDLVPNSRNARIHDDAQVDQIARSIQEFGFTNPILPVSRPPGLVRLAPGSE